MERHRIVSHEDSNSEADSEESFDHGTVASDEHASSDEQENIAGEGDNGDDSDEDEGRDEDGDSSSDSQNSTDDDDEDDNVWSSIRDLSWTIKLLQWGQERISKPRNDGQWGPSGSISTCSSQIKKKHHVQLCSKDSWCSKTL